MPTTTTTERDQARAELRAIFDTPGVAPAVYVVQRHVSASGMQRQLDLYVIVPGWRTHDGTEYPDLRRITWQAAKATGYGYSRRYDALTVNGCGMDMHFAVVYDLSATLYPETERAGYRLTHRTI